MLNDTSFFRDAPASAWRSVGERITLGVDKAGILSALTVPEAEAAIRVLQRAIAAVAAASVAAP